jgi:hypothetical protein
MVAVPLSQHPILVCAQQVGAELADVADAQAAYMSSDDKRAALLAIAEDKRRLDALALKVMAASADVAETDGARDIGAWLAHRTRAEARPLRIAQKLAAAIDKRWQRVEAGMAAGTVSVEQAQVIVDGLEVLPARLGAEVITDAEARLVAFAETCDPTELRILARRILDYVAPEIAEGEEARRLEQEEERARDKTSLRTRRLGNGWSRTTIVHADESADRLETYCESFASPRKQGDALTGEEDRIPYARRLGLAFAALLEHLNPKKLPDHGGDATTVFVTISLTALMADLAVGDGMSATAVRRLTCTANTIPAVLGSKGEVLDLGRKSRLFSRAQRRAMRLRDKRCRAEGCGVRAAWCEAHHLKPWSEGGQTNLDDGVLLCNYHHHRIHDRRFEHEILASGDIRFFLKR